MSKISVIVPVYNVEQYLERCLESIINQTFKDIEIICVNDGSTDNSAQILEKYAKKDKRIKIITQENKGLSGARNTGINNANGEYISFVDSDDYIDTSLYEKLINHLPAELICFDAEPFGKDNISENLKNNLISKRKGLQKVNDKLIKKTNIYAWSKLFKTDIIIQNNIRFPEGLYFEDFVFTWDYMLHIKTAYFMDDNKKYYFYRQNDISIMNNCSNKAIHHLYVWHHLYERLKSQNILNRHEKTIKQLFKKYFKLACKYSNKDQQNLIIETANKYAAEIDYKDIDALIAKTVKPKLLVHLHLYYHNQLNFMIKKLKNINNCDWDLYVTICEENQKSINKILKFKPDAKIILAENKGYDIWPFIQVLHKVDLDDYDFILKIHTKNYRKKKYSGTCGFGWRNLLINALIKNKKRFRKNISKLKTLPEIGMIATDEFFRQMGNVVKEDTVLFDDFIKQYNLPLKLGKFVAGTMFLARANCFKIIKDLNITEQSFSYKLESDSNGTIAHTLERVFSRIIEMQNYKIYTIPDRMYEFKQSFKSSLRNILALRNEYLNDKKCKVITFFGFKYHLPNSAGGQE